MTETIATIRIFYLRITCSINSLRERIIKGEHEALDLIFRSHIDDLYKHAN